MKNYKGFKAGQDFSISISKHISILIVCVASLRTHSVALLKQYTLSITAGHVFYTHTATAHTTNGYHDDPKWCALVTNTLITFVDTSCQNLC